MSERLTLNTVRKDVKTAFDWQIAGGMVPSQETRAAQARVMAFLAQCEADQTRLQAALAACQAFVDVKDSGEVWDLAQKALGN